MICVILMIVAIVIAIIAIIAVATGHDNLVPVATMTVAIVLSFCLGLFNTLMRVGYVDIYENLHKEYEEIVLLYDTIDKSDNEYLRYNFYERIEEYNEQYDCYVNDLNSPWFNWLVYDDVDDIEPIEFNWKGVPND